MKSASKDPADIAYRVGRDISGPVFSAYVSWVIDRASALGVETLLFLARDGQMLYKLAKVQNPPMNVHYVAASRASWYPCSPSALSADMLAERIRNEYRTAARLCRALKIDDRELMTTFDFDPDLPLNSRQASEIAIFLSVGLGKCILEKAALAQRNLLLSYLLDFEGVGPDRCIGIVDIGWKGSLQRILQKIWSEAGFSRAIHGFYFGIRQKANAENYHGFAYKNSAFPHWLEAYPSVIEMLTPADHGSVVGFKDDGVRSVPTYAENPVLQPELVRSIHQGAADWIASRPALSKEESLKRLRRAIEQPSRETADFFSNFLFESSLFAEQGSSLVPRFSLLRSIGYLMAPSRNFTEWPWPQATLRRSSLPPCGFLTRKFYFYSLGKTVYHRGRKLLRSLVREPDLVSLDVFDTVLFRDTRYPRDVFKLLEDRFSIEGFAKARMEAEERCRMESESRETSLDYIYQRIANEHPAWPASDLQQEELKLEESLIFTTNRVTTWVKRLREKQGRLLFVSDMYLPSAWISVQLRRHGIMAEYDELWVSCENAASKRNRQLYRKIWTKEQPANWRHYGDNLRSDVICALLEGVVPAWRPARSSWARYLNSLSLLPSARVSKLSSYPKADHWNPNDSSEPK